MASIPGMVLGFTRPMNTQEIGKGWMDSIVEWHARPDCDEKHDWPMEAPLEITVRSGWHPIGQPMEAREIAILLGTGGPAVRIVADIDGRNGAVLNPRLQVQDWGTPWMDCVLTSEQREAVEAFAACFEGLAA